MTAAEPTTRVQVTQFMLGVFSMQVCAVNAATDEEILEVANRENPSGTSNGWCSVVRSDPEFPKRDPVPCATCPETRTHFLVDC